MCLLFLFKEKPIPLNRFSISPVKFNIERSKKKFKNMFPELSDAQCDELAEYEETLYQASYRATKGVVGQLVFSVGFTRPENLDKTLMISS